MKRTRNTFEGPIVTGTGSTARNKRRLAGDLSNAEVQLYRNLQVRPYTSYKNSLVPTATRGYKLNNTELKVADLGVVSFATVAATPVAYLMAVPQQGTGFDQRIGRKITLKSFYIKGTVATSAGGDGDPSQIDVPCSHARMIVFCDYQPNGTLATITDLLKQNNSLSMLNLNNRDRFKILCDKEFVLDPYLLDKSATQSYASANNQIKYFKKYKRLNIETIFNETNGGSIADITTGALLVAFISTGIVDDSTALVWNMSARVRYSDD